MEIQNQGNLSILQLNKDKKLLTEEERKKITSALLTSTEPLKPKEQPKTLKFPSWNSKKKAS